ncbi:hypothetical protein SporoP37_10520 [Sporosarcina sp. P37]|uniref:hypothetical protein n=1 Tax=unclassified Sporosarcina TaxID=2647733 RepID=UPI0009BD238E|nr:MULTISPECIES: hypothetical protein [unclassified Sporosarcina]ARD48533.1 hypothetical protein SporoP33_10105 [Sporosarcina sp. P33]ARK25038.1 hypothetical protein SporoP37_10520 [Sporosarcina sp. P37]PID18184.1 hypothetical protein CSV62_09855 [Sporosarcina sp. P35]
MKEWFIQLSGQMVKHTENNKFVDFPKKLVIGNEMLLTSRCKDSVRFRILPAETDAFLRGRGGLARSALAITPVTLILQESPVLPGESLSLCPQVS